MVVVRQSERIIMLGTVVPGLAFSAATGYVLTQYYWVDMLSALVSTPEDWLAGEDPYQGVVPMTSLSVTEIADRVSRLRKSTIVGSCIDMLPYESEHDAEVLRLRSLPNVRYFMNLIDEPTLAEQVVWGEGYGAREDDLMWLIRDKLGRICGTNRLYDINPGTAEKGSQIVEPEIARALPAALESDVTIIETAFNTFNVEKIIATIREDNTQVKSMNERFGFVPQSESKIREVRYVKYVLAREAWNPSPFRAILEHWARHYT